MGPETALTEHWQANPEHRALLAKDALRQLAFFRPSLRPDGGFDVLDYAGNPLPRTAQELHTTTRMVHSYALGKAFGATDCDAVIDAGMDFLWTRHRDTRHGGYCWSVGDNGDGIKLAYGHVFVLLAGASSLKAGHPDAARLIDDVTGILDKHFWDEERGLLKDEFRQDWSVFSDYRGMNANMHGVEAMLGAYEATGSAVHLQRAGRILDFFVGEIAPRHGWRLPEHYTPDWTVDPDYEGDPMFRPKGSTPGHSFELGRLTLQHWDLAGRADEQAPARARRLIETALEDAWLDGRGFAYTLDSGGAVLRANRYWWPVTEAIGAVSTLLKTDGSEADEQWYRDLWRCASDLFIDHDRGGWYPELDAFGQPTSIQFAGKPDIYHALQADLLPLVDGISRVFDGLERESGGSGRDTGGNN